MNRRFEAAVEQLRWQYDHAGDPGANGATIACGINQGEREPEDMILYAWGDGARILYDILKAAGIWPGGPDCTPFPSKPNPN